ncbi:unnamed protein product, partial [marine sediment metagenome]
IGYKMRMGTATADDRQTLKELRGKMKGIQGEVEKSPFVAKSFGTLAPFLVNSAKKGGWGALIGAGVGGTISLLAGTFVPGAAAVPDEALTGPVLMGAGAKIGGMFASVEDIRQIEGGSAYLDFTEDYGMTHEKASIASDIVGGGSALLEMAQFKLLKRLLPNGGKVVNGAVTKA